jgi:hypothetical protein
MLGNGRFTSVSSSPWLYIQSEALQDIAFHLPPSESGRRLERLCSKFDVGRRGGRALDAMNTGHPEVRVDQPKLECREQTSSGLQNAQAVCDLATAHA